MAIWIRAGAVEILSEEAIKFGSQMQSEANNAAQFEVIPEAPHDIMFVGNILGFGAEAENAARADETFIRAH